MEDLPESEELPQSETELIAEARRLIALLTDNPKFAGLPVSADEMRKRLDKFIAARNAEAAINVAVLQAEAAVQKAFDELNDAWAKAEESQWRIGTAANSVALMLTNSGRGKAVLSKKR